MAENIHVYSSKDVAPEALAGKGLVLVDFWATWCGPCRMLAPVVEELAEEIPQVLFAKLNVDENDEACIRYNVSSIPLLILFKDGQIVDTSVGYRPKSAIKAMIEKHI